MQIIKKKKYKTDLFFLFPTFLSIANYEQSIPNHMNDLKARILCYYCVIEFDRCAYVFIDLNTFKVPGTLIPRSYRKIRLSSNAEEKWDEESLSFDGLNADESATINVLGKRIQNDVD